MRLAAAVQAPWVVMRSGRRAPKEPRANLGCRSASCAVGECGFNGSCALSQQIMPVPRGTVSSVQHSHGLRSTRSCVRLARLQWSSSFAEPGLLHPGAANAKQIPRRRPCIRGRMGHRPHIAEKSSRQAKPANVTDGIYKPPGCANLQTYANSTGKWESTS